MRELMAHSVSIWERDPQMYSYHPVGYMQISPEVMHKDVASIYAQQKEMLGLMVYDGMIELALVERTLGDYVAFSWEKYKSFTYDRRNEDPYLNEYFEWLANRLDNYMRSNPRTPAYAATAQSQPH